MSYSTEASRVCDLIEKRGEPVAHGEINWLLSVDKYKSQGILRSPRVRGLIVPVVVNGVGGYHPLAVKDSGETPDTHEIRNSNRTLRVEVIDVEQPPPAVLDRVEDLAQLIYKTHVETVSTQSDPVASREPYERMG